MKEILFIIITITSSPVLSPVSENKWDMVIEKNYYYSGFDNVETKLFYYKEDLDGYINSRNLSGSILVDVKAGKTHYIQSEPITKKVIKEETIGFKTKLFDYNKTKDSIFIKLSGIQKFRDSVMFRDSLRIFKKNINYIK